MNATKFSLHLYTKYGSLHHQSLTKIVQTLKHTKLTVRKKRAMARKKENVQKKKGYSKRKKIHWAEIVPYFTV